MAFLSRRGEESLSPPDFKISPAPGTYAILLELSGHKLIPIGRKGALEFSHGFYLYIGSAFGPGGLNARLLRHLQLSTRPHWHIDYLRRHSEPREVWYSIAVQQEHIWAAAAAAMRGASTPVPGFGSSGCACPSHLYCFPTPPSLRAFRPKLPRPVPRIERIIVGP